MNGDLLLLTKLTSDSRWLNENIDEVRKEHEHKFVAVEDGKVIDQNENFEELVENLKKGGKNPVTILIRFIHKKGEALIL